MSYRDIANMPGIGGSLGMCALCGDTFMAEILMGRKVQTVAIEGMGKLKTWSSLEKATHWMPLPEPPPEGWGAALMAERDAGSDVILHFGRSNVIGCLRTTSRHALRPYAAARPSLGPFLSLDQGRRNGPTCFSLSGVHALPSRADA